MYRVDFIDVEKNKKSFSKEMKDINYDNLYDAVKPYLPNRFSVGFGVNDKDRSGVVIVGFRIVGRFKFYKIEDSEYEL
ncbi:hypothetical protein [Clostridium perfringens]|uniref:hypothetical protein n=1 Tax=Clostridium perfringens TaxID=1502 RepID=UPI003218EAB6